jgi:hypothetical protein
VPMQAGLSPPARLPSKRRSRRILPWRTIDTAPAAGPQAYSGASHRPRSDPRRTCGPNASGMEPRNVGRSIVGFLIFHGLSRPTLENPFRSIYCSRRPPIRMGTKCPSPIRFFARTRDLRITKFHIRAYAIDSTFGPCPLSWANSAWRALIESDFESNFFVQATKRRPAWENDRRLKINDNGVYGGEYRCMEISNFPEFRNESAS